MNPSHIVLSPGPKAPKDAGICMEIVKELYKEYPILGICLGHQAIGAAFGGKITYAKELYHGKYSMITHEGKGVFQGIKSPCQIARYHSLAVEDGFSNEFEILARTEDREIMAMCHREYPLIGLQFHPESNRGHSARRCHLAACSYYNQTYYRLTSNSTHPSVLVVPLPCHL